MNTNNTDTTEKSLKWFDELGDIREKYLMAKKHLGDNWTGEITTNIIEMLYLAENPTKSPELKNGITCPHCGNTKKIESGLCGVCGKFPPMVKEADNSGEWFNGIKLVASKRGGSIVVYDEPEERITGDFWYDTSNEKEKEQLVNHIINCVNAHDELVMALKNSVDWMGYLLADIDAGNVFYEENYVNELRAEILKAKELLNRINNQ